jgi:hypothetical protein
VISYRKIIPPLGAVLLALSTLTSPASAAPQPTAIAGVQTFEAVVESVDPSTREILVSTPSGRLATIVAGPQVRNFNQIKPGDKIKLTYQEEIAVKLAPAGSPMQGPLVGVGAGRAALGKLPAGTVFQVVQVQVKIDAVDKATGKVDFTRADGTTGSIVPRHADMLAFARQLKPGDQVDIASLQALTVVVEKGS